MVFMLKIISQFRVILFFIILLILCLVLFNTYSIMYNLAGKVFDIIETLLLLLLLLYHHSVCDIYYIRMLFIRESLHTIIVRLCYFKISTFVMCV